MIRLAVPSLPPSTNHAYFNLPGGGRSKTDVARKYIQETVSHLARNYPRELTLLRKNAPLLLIVRFYFESLNNKGWPKKSDNRYKKLDATNRIKLVEDCLSTVGGIDDSQHMTVVQQKRQGLPERTELFVWNLETEETPLDDVLGTL